MAEVKTPFVPYNARLDQAATAPSGVIMFISGGLSSKCSDKDITDIAQFLRYLCFVCWVNGPLGRITEDLRP